MRNESFLTQSINIDEQYLYTREAHDFDKNPVVMARVIMRTLYTARDLAGNLFYHEGGNYKQRGELAVGEMYHKVLSLSEKTGSWRSSFRNEIFQYILDRSPFILDRPDLYKINLLNGVYDWSTGEFKPHDASYLTTVQIPINYDPNATCPYWDEFLTTVFPEGEQLLRELIALCMIPFMGLQKCVVLVGQGSNGKSAFLDAMKAAIGVQNTCAVSLHRLTSNQERFFTAGLIGKLVNIFGDLSPKAIEDTANFKALTGEDEVTIEYKGKQPFTYRPFTRLIFSCNKVVKSEDDTSLGYQRRFIHIPFLQQFQLDPAKGQDIRENTSNPTELSGLFNRLIPLFSQITENGFTWTPELAALVDNYTPIPDEFKLWLTTHVIEDPNGYLPGSAFYDHFVQTVRAVETFSRANLITYMKNVFPRCKASHSVRIWQGVDPIKCYKGVRMLNNTDQINIVEHAYKVRMSRQTAEEEPVS